MVIKDLIHLKRVATQACKIFVFKDRFILNNWVRSKRSGVQVLSLSCSFKQPMKKYSSSDVCVIAANRVRTRATFSEWSCQKCATLTSSIFVIQQSVSVVHRPTIVTCYTATANGYGHWSEGSLVRKVPKRYQNYYLYL